MQTDTSISTLHLAGDAYVCCVGGELVEQSAGAVRDALDRIQALGGRRLIVDLCAVDHLDAIGLELLLLTAEQLHPVGGELVVVADHPRVLRLVEGPDAAGRFRLERTLALAVGGIATGAADS